VGAVQQIRIRTQAAPQMTGHEVAGLQILEGAVRKSMPPPSYPSTFVNSLDSTHASLRTTL
jgi:hypothetical protein